MHPRMAVSKARLKSPLFLDDTGSCGPRGSDDWAPCRVPLTCVYVWDSIPHRRLNQAGCHSERLSGVPSKPAFGLLGRRGPQQTRGPQRSRFCFVGVETRLWFAGAEPRGILARTGPAQDPSARAPLASSRRASLGMTILGKVSYQGTALAVPQSRLEKLGFSP